MITDYIDDFFIFDWVSTFKAGADRERAIDTTPKRSKLVNYGLRGRAGVGGGYWGVGMQSPLCQYTQTSV